MSWVTNEVGIEFLDPGEFFSKAARLPAGHITSFSGVIPVGPGDRMAGLADQIANVVGVLVGRLEEAGLSIRNVYRVVVFCAVPIVELYNNFNTTYVIMLKGAGLTVMPARTMVEVAGLPNGASVEFQIDAFRPVSGEHGRAQSPNDSLAARGRAEFNLG